MPLNIRVRQQVVRKLEAYEGRVSHFYLDSVGKVTVGVGHLIADRGAVAGFDMIVVPSGPLASLAEKQDEYDRIAAETVGYRASHYRAAARLLMPDAEISRLRDRHVRTFHRELQAIYTRHNGYPDDFDALPEVVQMALFDLIFNLGATRLRHVFVNLDRAIRAGDWLRAAAESYRPQVSAARNWYVRQLFLSATGVPVACVPAC
ncbi:MAG: hypothetical protein DWQ11_14365 [Proteobacteria bacterium]|nr:MAG: hypothetical protein DWQ11_14365 [Pseudomonadota bacterium]